VSNCALASFDTPVYGDYAEVLAYVMPTLAAGASKTINIQYVRD
jgi:hypothetical protein